MTEAVSACPYIQIRVLEKYEEASFQLSKVGDYLRWKILQEWDGDFRVRSGESFPLLQLEVIHADGTLAVTELKSNSVLGSIAILENPTRVVFEHFMRVREREEEARSVVIYNPLGCYIMLKDEITLRGERSTNNFLIVCTGKVGDAV